MIRKSTATWQGNGLEGEGKLSMQSGTFHNQPYSFQTRFQNEDGKQGTNPEELIGAAHAGCFAMALSFALTEAGYTPEELFVTASVNIEKEKEGFLITHIALELEGRVSGIEEKEFQILAEKAKTSCPISKALAATPITLTAKLY